MAVEVATQKIRWGELEEDDEGDLDFLLPPRVVSGPDENGFKKVVEYRFDDKGNKVKVTRTFRVRKIARARLSKSAIERRSWPKFGDAVQEDVGARLTMVSTEEIVLERPRAPGCHCSCASPFLSRSASIDVFSNRIICLSLCAIFIRTRHDVLECFVLSIPLCEIDYRIEAGDLFRKQLVLLSLNTTYVRTLL
jgi:translation initiation factor 3 subunit G